MLEKTEGQSRMDNPKKLATLDEDKKTKTNKNKNKTKQINTNNNTTAQKA